ncbi:FAD-dependent oxidoreductase, partial [Sagittula marina]
MLLFTIWFQQKMLFARAIAKEPALLRRVGWGQTKGLHMSAPLLAVTTSNTIPKDADCVVIGGGIVGVCAAWWLAREGQNVVLVEKG